MVEGMSYDYLDQPPEELPSKEKIEGEIMNFLEGKNYTVSGKKVETDGEDVSLFEMTVLLDGEPAEFNYQRAKYDHTKPGLPTSARFSASIHVIFYDSDGMPAGGGCIANYRDGQWEKGGQWK